MILTEGLDKLETYSRLSPLWRKRLMRSRPTTTNSKQKTASCKIILVA
jgi:hypothetical protein